MHYVVILKLAVCKVSGCERIFYSKAKGLMGAIIYLYTFLEGHGEKMTIVYCKHREMLLPFGGGDWTRIFCRIGPLVVSVTILNQA